MTLQDSSNKFSLFLDTSYGIAIGLLDENYEWLEFETLEGRKSSEIIHERIHHYLGQHGINVDSVDLFVLSGPGSYTGLRVSQGIAQIFELNGSCVYSFNIFKVGQILGDLIDPRFKWIFPAFKGEVYIRGIGDSDGDLVDENLELIGQYITHGENKFDVASKLNSRDLIKNNASRLFLELKKQSVRDDIFYFRSLDKEFSK